MLKKQFILREEASDFGGGGGGNLEIPEDFQTNFTDEDDDDFNLEPLRNNQKTREELDLESEASEKGITVDELREQKEKEANDLKSLEEEAKEKGITVDELKEEKELEAESEKTGKTVDELKKEKQEEKKKKSDEDEVKALEDKLKEEGKSEEEIEKEVEKLKAEIEKRDDDFDIDPFKGYKASTSDDDSSKKVDVDYNKLALDLELELEEGTEIKSLDDFKEATKKTIEKAKQTIDTSQLTPEAKMLFDNFQKNKNLQVTDFYRNDVLRNLDAFANLSNEIKVKNILAEELKGITAPENLKDAIEDKFAEMTEEQIESKVKEINREITKRKTQEFNKIIKAKNEFFEKESEREAEVIKNQKKALVSKVQVMTEYMGFPIPKEAIYEIVKEIENDSFQKYLDKNVEEAKINAYIGTKFGKKFSESYKKILAITKTDAYKKGLEVYKQQKHNITSSGHKTKSNRTPGDLKFSDDLFKER
jgi:hypothetical protein